MQHHHAAAGLALAVLIVPGLAGPAGPQRPVPFQGKFEGVQTVISFDCPIRTVLTRGMGNAAQLDRFQLAIPHEVNVSTSTAIGSYQFTAADGDTLFADFRGESSPTSFRNVLAIKEAATITGGTGRFASTTGSFVVKRHFNKITGTTTGSFDGIIFTTGQRNQGDLP